jgi:uncharacterized damage-inducible protein DinB
MNALGRPGPEEANAYFNGYVELADGRDLLEALANASELAWAAVQLIPAEKAGYRYAPGKWTIEQLFQHVVDTERIFAYRALRFARNDATELPGFDENTYADATAHSGRSLRRIMAEHDAVRNATIELYRGLNAEELLRTGVANGARISVRALGWTVAGHVTHHMRVLHERYL